MTSHNTFVVIILNLHMLYCSYLYNNIFSLADFKFNIELLHDQSNDTSKLPIKCTAETDLRLRWAQHPKALNVSHRGIFIAYWDCPVIRAEEYRHVNTSSGGITFVSKRLNMVKLKLLRMSAGNNFNFLTPCFCFVE